MFSNVQVIHDPNPTKKYFVPRQQCPSKNVSLVPATSRSLWNLAGVCLPYHDIFAEVVYLKVIRQELNPLTVFKSEQVSILPSEHEPQGDRNYDFLPIQFDGFSLEGTFPTPGELTVMRG